MKREGLGKATLIAFLVRGIGALAGFAMTIAISRSLGVDDAGRLFLAFALVNVLAVLCCCGLDTAVVRYVGIFAADKRWGAVNSTISLALKVSVTVGVLIGATTYGLSSYVGSYISSTSSVVGAFQNVAGVIPAIAGMTILSQAFLGLRRVPASIFISLISIQLCVSIGLIFVSTIELAAEIYLVSGFVTLGLALVLWKKYTPKGFDGVFDKSAIINSCFPLWLVALMGNLQQWGGQFVAGVMLSPSDVAVMATASRVTFIVSFILMATNMVVAPRFASLHRNGSYDELAFVARRSLRIVLLVSAPVFALLFLLSDEVMGIFGDQYASGSRVLQILLLGQLVNVATGSVGVLLNMSGHERDSRNVAFLVTPLTLVLAVFSTYFFGLIGTASAFAAGLAVQNLASAMLVRERLGFWILKIW